MDVVTAAVCIVAAFVAALVHYAILPEPRQPRLTVAFGVALLVALLIFAAGPRVLGGG